ncbi:hypothetical protein Mp_1g25490 [Marchantia polymorpha subsp. ruderalis]|nr:hypothetical protein MARPO_0002s0323 [Marchantia polymorpha]BBM99991.1 hypothetical protein Mp_1g25490 [Marchantia polymorpha subsp. ruderalis]|eukprot:PTQ49888.1 hypothetical protein MARPO_0002s0323 [Marchantia polymorpha]
MSRKTSLLVVGGRICTRLGHTDRLVAVGLWSRSCRASRCTLRVLPSHTRRFRDYEAGRCSKKAAGIVR